MTDTSGVALTPNTRYIEEEILLRVGKDLMMVQIREHIKELQNERLAEENEKLKTENLNLRERITAQERDIDQLRVQLGGKPVPRRGKKAT